MQFRESRAILAYIADSRNPTSELVPHVPKTLATMNQRLYYEFGVLTKANSDLIVSTNYNIILSIIVYFVLRYWTHCYDY